MSLEIVTIADAVFGSRAKVLPGIGFNCYGFSVPTASGPLETLYAAPDFTDGTSKPTHSGIPLLFPFAGRLRGTSFQFEGQTYELEAGDGIGNAIHGFVYKRPWRVVKQEPSEVVGQFQASVDDESILEHWPADFRITATYRIAGNVLTSEYVIENPDDKPLPFGFGTHPYFRVPLGGGDTKSCRVTVPVSTCWDLKDMLPTGQTAADDVAAELAAGMPLDAMKLDTVFGGIKFDEHRATATIHDEASGRTVTQTFDDQFTTCVVYNPPHREAVCVEPYTTVPDAFSLHEQGIDPHLRILPPGESFRTVITIHVA